MRTDEAACAARMASIASLSLSTALPSLLLGPTCRSSIAIEDTAASSGARSHRPSSHASARTKSARTESAEGASSVCPPSPSPVGETGEMPAACGRGLHDAGAEAPELVCEERLVRRKRRRDDELHQRARRWHDWPQRVHALLRERRSRRNCFGHSVYVVRRAARLAVRLSAVVREHAQQLGLLSLGQRSPPPRAVHVLQKGFKHTDSGWRRRRSGVAALGRGEPLLIARSQGGAELRAPVRRAHARDRALERAFCGACSVGLRLKFAPLRRLAN
eukprot:1575-Pleurochrysis_carterae.AAC.2